MKKECNYCHEIKSFDEYFNSSTSADRKAYRCKACTVKLRWEWCKNNPEKYRAQLDRRKVSKTHFSPTARKNKLNRQIWHRKTMSDSYIRNLIKTTTNLKDKDITDKFVKFWRINLKMKRQLNKTAGIRDYE